MEKSKGDHSKRGMQWYVGKLYYWWENILFKKKKNYPLTLKKKIF